MDLCKIDALIAEHVMDKELFEFSQKVQIRHGCDSGEWETHKERRIKEEDYYEGLKIPKYSSDIAAAWEVVEEMGLFNGPYLTHYSSKEWRVEVDMHDGEISILGSAETVPLTICLAAHKLKGVELK